MSHFIYRYNTSLGWCFSAGCCYVSLMHGMSSRFFTSLQARALVALRNPAFLPRQQWLARNPQTLALTVTL